MRNTVKFNSLKTDYPKICQVLNMQQKSSINPVVAHVSIHEVNDAPPGTTAHVRGAQV